MATNVSEPSERFAIQYAQLAREIAQDIFPLDHILEMHKVSDEDWTRIQANPRFQAMLSEMVLSWNAAANTKERIRVKAATGLEAVLETYIRGCVDETIPFTQRIEGGKFIARLGEIDGGKIEGSTGGGFGVTINIGVLTRHAEATAIVTGNVIEHEREEAGA